ncbi:DUF3789 domain-containing protein [Clostridium perfringens]|nr:DUF3789 domain-containing protein [Clostridium perfringens]MDK0728317.1 DUF3789 domain-containing protein [Clostridium perfringens]MDK0803617.1 DUF3789 domain-containing protein [Clostridium perfringens]MDM0547934.1 DUF3789 domain-containing protein [Clostridium perfringens]MDM0561866.1 DUF3789 domain-containing protein [Clostridium perfringens]MDM0565509.1 DUF3789 domain-containing protein [Clostridium perfringens]
MYEVIKDLLLISLVGGIDIVTMCLVQSGKLADERMETINRERNGKE